MWLYSTHVNGLRRDKRSVFACGYAVTWGESAFAIGFQGAPTLPPEARFPPTLSIEGTYAELLLSNF